MKPRDWNDRMCHGDRCLLFWLLCVIAFFGFAPSLRAETYVAGEFGLVLPQKNDGNVEVSGGGFPPGTPASNLVFKNTFLGGARLGHYFESTPWFGLSTEVFYSTPNIKQQTLLVSPPGSAPSQNVAIQGQSNQLVTWATNLEFRRPGGKFEPYGGVGVGVFFARLHDGLTDTSRSSTSPGLNIYAGGRYRFTEHLSAFAEWKFNYVRFDFDPAPNLVGFSTNYAAQIIAVGAGYHF